MCELMSLACWLWLGFGTSLRAQQLPTLALVLALVLSGRCFALCCSAGAFAHACWLCEKQRAKLSRSCSMCMRSVMHVFLAQLSFFFF